MSGIAGIVNFDGAPVLAGLVESMTSCMARRGPDGIRHWVRGSAAMGQCMLHTTAESLEECQPLTNEDESLVLVMDGRVDNWEELRRELLSRRAVLRDRTDAELMLRAYEVWGRECLAHIDGDFALAIWDAQRQNVFCARDRMGNKPFFYHWDGKTFTFASELRAIIALPWVREEPNQGVLAEWLAAEWYSRDETPWTGILRLVPAHRMLAGFQGPRIELYWEPDLWATPPFRKEEDYIEHYQELLFDSVRRLSRSHRVVAIDVSGGLDSSALFCVAAQLRRDDKLPAPGIEGYTLAFKEEDGEAYELPYARAAGEYWGLKVNEIAHSRMPLSWYEERARAERDFPGFPNATLAMTLSRQASAQGSRVELSGTGGDQFLDGTRLYYAEELAKLRWRTLHNCFKTDMAVFGMRQAVAWLIREGFFPLLRSDVQEGVLRVVPRMRGGATSPSPCYWLSPRMREELSLRRKISTQQPKVRNAGQVELLNALHDAFRSHVMDGFERLVADCGIEMRYPFYDTKLVQYAFSTPERLRLRGDVNKYIHVQALRNFMPTLILERGKKADFSVVSREYLDRMQETLTATIPRKRTNWVDADGMSRLFEAYRDNSQAGWPLWVLWGIYGCDLLYR